MRTTKKLLAMIFVVVLSISIIPITNVSAAKKVKLNKTKTTIYVGKTVTLKLKNNKKKVKWTTSNKKIATVSKKGKVKGKKAGKVTITAKVRKKKYKCKITVKKKVTKKPTTKPTEQPTTKPTEKPTTKPIEQPTTTPSEQPTVAEPTTPSDDIEEPSLNPQISKNVETLQKITKIQQEQGIVDEDTLKEINALNESEANDIKDFMPGFDIEDAVQGIINDTAQYNKYIEYHGGYYDDEYYTGDYRGVLEFNDSIVKYMCDGVDFDNPYIDLTVDDLANTYKYTMFEDDIFSTSYYDCQYKQILANYMKIGHPKFDSIDMYILETTPIQKHYEFTLGGISMSYDYPKFDDKYCSYIVTFSSNGVIYNAYMSFAEVEYDNGDVHYEYRLLDLTDTSKFIENYWHYDENEVKALKEIIAEQKEQGATVSEDIFDTNEYFWNYGKLTTILWDNNNLTGVLDTSAFSSLECLKCGVNQLTNLDISKNNSLKILGCEYNQLISLEVSNNKLLEALYCHGNKLTSLNVSNNSLLEELDCDENVTVTGWRK